MFIKRNKFIDKVSKDDDIEYTKSILDLLEKAESNFLLYESAVLKNKIDDSKLYLNEYQK
jgi:hypothetical protein